METIRASAPPPRDSSGSAQSLVNNPEPTRGSPPPKKSPLRRWAAAAIIGAGLLCAIATFVVGLSNKSASQRDYIEYWAAGQQVVRGADPYDIAGVLAVERTAGYADDQPMITLSPPIVLLLALPLGFVSAKSGLILWSLAIIACLSASIFLLWTLCGRPDNRFHLLGYLFPPALACLMAGQIGVFLLLGIVLFLRFYQSRPFLAGMALLPCALKPHLFLPFACVLLLWIIGRRTYRMLAGWAAVLIAASAIALCIDRHIWQQYLALAHNTTILPVFIPTLSVALRLLVARSHIGVQFVPEAAACLWALWFYRTRRARWDWMHHGLLVLLVSMLCTPYAWFTDESILLPAVLVGVYRATGAGRSLVPLYLIAGAALIELLAQIQLTTPGYIWTTPAWLGWYLYATRKTSAVVA
jgi:hypothetical protein